MLDDLLSDYQRLVSLGHTPYLTIGNWHHISPELQAEGCARHRAVDAAHLEGDYSLLRANPVRIEISGGGGWQEFGSFPPPGVRKAGIYLHEAGSLDSAEPRTDSQFPISTIRPTRPRALVAPISPFPAPVRSTTESSKNARMSRFSPQVRWPKILSCSARRN